MNNNTIYDYDLFIKEINNYITQQKINSNMKIIKALKDTINVYESLNKLNPEEANTYLSILFAALSISKK